MMQSSIGNIKSYSGLGGEINEASGGDNSLSIAGNIKYIMPITQMRQALPLPPVISESFSDHLPPLDFDNFGIKQGEHISSVKRARLIHWIDDSSSKEMAAQRHEAAKRIIMCYGNAQKELELSSLNLNELPPVIPLHVTILSIDLNELTSLPAGELQHVKFLDCSNNPLKSFPEKLSSVTHLSFYNTPIKDEWYKYLKNNIENYPKLELLASKNRNHFMSVSRTEPK